MHLEIKVRLVSRTGPAGPPDLFLIFIFNWRTIVLQFGFGFCHITMQINCKYIYISIYPLPLGPPSYPSCTLMFTASLFTIARTWKQPKWPSTDEEIKMLWYTYTKDYYLATKRKKCESFELRWMNLCLLHAVVFYLLSLDSVLQGHVHRVTQFSDRNPEAPIPYIQWYKVCTRLSTAFDTFMSDYCVLLYLLAQIATAWYRDLFLKKACSGVCWLGDIFNNCIDQFALSSFCAPVRGPGGGREEQAGDPSLPAQFPSPCPKLPPPRRPCPPGQFCSRLFTDLGFLPGFPLLLCGSVCFHLLFILFHVLLQQFTYLGLNFCFICFFIGFLVNFFP